MGKQETTTECDIDPLESGASMHHRDLHAELAALRAEVNRLQKDRNNLRANLQLLGAISSSAIELNRPHDPVSVAKTLPEASRVFKKYRTKP